ncbi:hypothetical protein G9A89_016116 [Geosiphon pyriformis]|nr:hypothetical protein G9A89_016116 [Geosiphon pyriformis]
MASIDNNTELESLAKEYRGLRKVHENSEAGVKDVESRKQEIMKKLGEALGKSGTFAGEILSHLGEPDELSFNLEEPQSFISTMPGPIIGSQIGGGAAAASAGSSDKIPYYLIYFLRGEHEYMYFKVDSQQEKVLSHGWHQKSG